MWKHVERSDWNAVKAALATRKGRSEARRITFTSESILSQAIEHHKSRLPASVVAALVDAAPGVLETSDLRGRLPLHLVCDLDCTYEVFRVILEASHPISTLTRCEHGRTPLHYAVARTCALSDMLAATAALPESAENSSSCRQLSVKPKVKGGKDKDKRGGEGGADTEMGDAEVDDDGGKASMAEADEVAASVASVVASVATSASQQQRKRKMNEAVDILVCLAFASPKAILVEDKYGDTPWDVVLTWVETKTIESESDSLDGHCLRLQDLIRRILRHAIAFNSIDDNNQEDQGESTTRDGETITTGSSGEKKKPEHSYTPSTQQADRRSSATSGSQPQQEQPQQQQQPHPQPQPQLQQQEQARRRRRDPQQRSRIRRRPLYSTETPQDGDGSDETDAMSVDPEA